MTRQLLNMNSQIGKMIRSLIKNIQLINIIDNKNFES